MVGLNENIENLNQLEFVIFCIENIAAKLGKPADSVYDALLSSDILNGYIVPEYEVLHTQSKEYIIEDILEVMRESGVQL